MHQFQLVQTTGMLIQILTGNKLIQQDNLISLLTASLTLVLGNQTTIMGSLFILIKDTETLLEAIQHLQCKQLLHKVSLTIKTSNHQHIDK